MSTPPKYHFSGIQRFSKNGGARSHGYVPRLQQVGFRIRAVMIYNKGLTLSCQSKQGHTTGEIINFMSVDAERIGDFIWYMHGPWMVIVQVTLALLILYKNVGLASFAAFFATVIVMLANVPLGKWEEKLQGKLMESKDKRMKATSEISRNMVPEYRRVEMFQLLSHFLSTKSYLWEHQQLSERMES